MNDREQIAKNVKTLRVHSNLSQKELAISLNFNTKRIDSIERGVAKITIDEVVAMCYLFKVNIDDFLTKKVVIKVNFE